MNLGQVIRGQQSMFIQGRVAGAATSAGRPRFPSPRLHCVLSGGIPRCCQASRETSSWVLHEPRSWFKRVNGRVTQMLAAMSVDCCFTHSHCCQHQSVVSVYKDIPSDIQHRQSSFLLFWTFSNCTTMCVYIHTMSNMISWDGTYEAFPPDLFGSPLLPFFPLFHWGEFLVSAPFLVPL